MDEDTLRSALDGLLGSVRSMQMATLDAQGQPHISYAPHVSLDNKFYLFLSGLAGHTGNLLRHAEFSFMLIEDEAACKQPFARKRLSCNGLAQIIPADDEQYTVILELFEARFGNVVALLKTLPDFRLFEVTVSDGSLVLGFGQAYAFQGEEFANLVHLRENR